MKRYTQWFGDEASARKFATWLLEKGNNGVYKLGKTVWLWNNAVHWDAPVENE